MNLISSTKCPLAGRRKQHVQDAVGDELHVRLVDADLRESSAKLALHSGLQTLPRLHDPALSDEILPWIMGSAHGDVAGPQWWQMLDGRRVQ